MKTVFAIMLAGVIGCAFVQPLSAADAAKFTEKVLHSFCSNQNCTDGARPTDDVIEVNGTLYGTTGLGGVYNGGAGTVFAFDLSTGKEKAIYSFCKRLQGYDCLDGAVPRGGLIDVNGTLYGTTEDGGNAGGQGRGSGTVFSIDPTTGAETVLHNFAGGTDGAVPEADLIDVNGVLYGTTFDGGTGCSNGGCGTVFSLDLGTGKEKVLHSFGSGTDGSQPFAGLIVVNGKLYGTTRAGGFYSAGAVFSIDLKTGVEKVLYSFCAQFGCPDGGDPEGTLIDVNGVLYGTSVAGAANANCTNNNFPSGCGTVFSFDPKTRVEKVIHSFCSQQNCTDGAYPSGKLIDIKGTLYGTTGQGGQPAGCSPIPGCGTVYSLDPNTGAETVLHSFGAGTGTDGLEPVSGLLTVNGTFYGTTLFGGAYNTDGTVFALKKKR